MSLDTSDSQKCPILVDCMNPQIVDTSCLEDQVLQAWFTSTRGVYQAWSSSDFVGSLWPN